MARNLDIEVTGEWSEATDADAATVTFLNHGPSPIRVRYMPNATSPTDNEGDRYGGGQGEREVTPSDVRVHMRADNGRAVVQIRTVDV